MKYLCNFQFLHRIKGCHSDPLDRAQGRLREESEWRLILIFNKVFIEPARVVCYQISHLRSK